MEWLVQFHSIWRYVVLLMALAAIIFSLLAYLGSRPWDNLTDRISFFFTLAMDIQVLVGIGVWLFADWDRNNSLLLWIHPLLMIAAVGLAHAGRVISERASDSRNKGGRATLFFVSSLVVVLVAIQFATRPL